MAEITPPTPKPVSAAARELANNPHLTICAMLWAMRHKLDEMTMIIDEQEMVKFKASLDHMEQRPKLVLQPIHSGLVIRMVDVETGNPIAQAENNDRDQDRKEERAKVRATIDSVNGLIDDHKRMRAAGADSDELLDEIYSAMRLLAKVAR